MPGLLNQKRSSTWNNQRAAANYVQAMALFCKRVLLRDDSPPGLQPSYRCCHLRTSPWRRGHHSSQGNMILLEQDVHHIVGTLVSLSFWFRVTLPT